MEFSWSADKEETLKAARGVTFEEVRISVRRDQMDDKLFEPVDDEESRIMESLAAAPIVSAANADEEKRKAIEAAKK